jgi:hypothetical protein
VPERGFEALGLCQWGEGFWVGRVVEESSTSSVSGSVAGGGGGGMVYVLGFDGRVGVSDFLVDAFGRDAMMGFCRESEEG